MYKKNLRRWSLCVFAATAISLTATSCGNGEDTDTDTDTTMNMQAPPPPPMEDTSMMMDTSGMDNADTRPIVKPTRDENAQ